MSSYRNSHARNKSEKILPLQSKAKAFLPLYNILFSRTPHQA